MNTNSLNSDFSLNHQEIEERINQWLDDHHILIVNPSEKMDDYFQARKRQISISSQEKINNNINRGSESNIITSFGLITLCSGIITEDEGSTNTLSSLSLEDEQVSQNKERRGSLQLQMIQAKIMKRRQSMNTNNNNNNNNKIEVLI